jgi:hypothetical protein
VWGEEEEEEEEQDKGCCRRRRRRRSKTRGVAGVIGRCWCSFFLGEGEG